MTLHSHFQGRMLYCASSPLCPVSDLHNCGHRTVPTRAEMNTCHCPIHELFFAEGEGSGACQSKNDWFQTERLYSVLSLTSDSAIDEEGFAIETHYDYGNDRAGYPSQCALTRRHFSHKPGAARENQDFFFRCPLLNLIVP